MKALIAYYSLTGTTRKLAQAIADHLKADSEEIIDYNDRSGLWGYFCAGRDAFLKRSTRIGNPSKDPANYDAIIIGTPVWALGITPAVRAYITKYRKSLKKVAFFCSKGGSPNHWAFADLEKLCGKKPVATLELREDELKTGESFHKIQRFAKSIG